MGKLHPADYFLRGSAAMEMRLADTCWNQETRNARDRDLCFRDFHELDLLP
jgi:hypothetical protein